MLPLGSDFFSITISKLERVSNLICELTPKVELRWFLRGVFKL